MPTNRTVGTHRFKYGELRTKPVARVSPEETTEIVGVPIEISGAGSSSEDGAELTYTWEVSSPIGSSVESVTAVDDDGSRVRLDPDVVGTFVVSLTVSNGLVESDTAYAKAFVSPSIVPAAKRVVPDGSFMFTVLSDFWKVVNDRQMFPVLWSGYTQIVASDFLRLLQVDRSKSIRTIQPLFQRRWMNYSPVLDLELGTLTMFLGHHQSGSGAFTGSVSFMDRGILVSSTEFILTSAVPTSKAVGTDLSVYEGENIGEYQINRLNSDSSGYIVSSTSAFPDYTEDIVASGADLITVSSSYEVTAASTDFAAAGAVAGDILRIDKGDNAGYYLIEGVGTEDGLSLDRQLLLKDAITYSGSNTNYTVFTSVRASYLREEIARTDTVFLPGSEADLTVFSRETLSGSGQVISPYEIKVQAEHITTGALGATLKITSGTDRGTTFVIADITGDGTGYVLTSAFTVVALPEDASYEIALTIDATDRLLILDEQGYGIAEVTYLEDLPSEEEGGRGPLWAVTLDKQAAPTNKEGLEWRIGSTLQSTDVDDFQKYGVSAGDLIEIEISRTDLGLASVVRATVTGCSGSELSFEMGAQDSLTFGKDENGAYVVPLFEAEDIETLSHDLHIPKVELSDIGEPIYTSTALELYLFLFGADFKKYLNTPLNTDTSLNISDYFNITVTPKRIIRNSRIALDPENEREDQPVYSIPAIFEYPTPENGDLNEDDEYVMVAKDGTVTTLDREPYSLVENSEFTVDSSGIIAGSDLSTVGGSGTITLPSAEMVSRKIRVGDTIEITSGLSKGFYILQHIISEETARVVSDPELNESETSPYPIATEEALDFEITRRHSGQFLIFNDLFSPATPAPENLWAPLTFYDNFKYIEDNFGVLVNLTKEDFDAYGRSQIAYRSAISALMFSWARGPTFSSALTGVHTLLDLAVTEALCHIVSIDAEYTDTHGRIVVEDMNTSLEATGMVRTYLYPNPEIYTLTHLSGLATNPDTGVEYAVGDIVPPYSVLSNSVYVSDYVSDPAWWKEYGTVPGSTELKKYHSWQVECDARYVDSRDLPLAYDFLMAIRPIYTLPSLVLTLALLDEITVEDDLYIDIELFFYDDPAHSVESTHIVDSYNDSSLSQRILDFGSFATRTLFQGDDLVIADGAIVALPQRSETQEFESEADDGLLATGDLVITYAVGTSAEVTTTITIEALTTLTTLAAEIDAISGISGSVEEVTPYYQIAVEGDDSGVLYAISFDTSGLDSDTGEVPVFTTVQEPIWGADVVYSARGGFVSGTTDNDGTQVLSSINRYFEDPIEIRGDSFVRVDDVLFIQSGRFLSLNVGRYKVTEILSDNYLRIDQLAGYPPRSLAPTEFEEEDEQHFQIQRIDKNPIVTGTDLATTASSNIIVSAGSSFQWEGITRDDYLIILTGADKGVHLIDQVGEWDPAPELFDDKGTKLTLRSALTADATGVEFEILRMGLRENPIYTGTASYSIGDTFLTSDAADLDLHLLETGDRLVMLSGSHEGEAFIVQIAGSQVIHVDRALSFTEALQPFEVRRPAFADHGGEFFIPDTDWRLERLHAYDECEMVIYRPMTEVYSSQWTLADDEEDDPAPIAVDEAAADLATTGVTAGMFLEIALETSDTDGDTVDDTTDSHSHGVYIIVAVSGSTLTVDSFFPGVYGSWGDGGLTIEEHKSGKVWEDDADFVIAGDSVSLVSGTDLEAIGVRIGDIFSFSGGDFRVLSVSTSTFTLSEDTGTSSTETGLISRRSIP